MLDSNFSPTSAAAPIFVGLYLWSPMFTTPNAAIWKHVFYFQIFCKKCLDSWVTPAIWVRSGSVRLFNGDTLTLPMSKFSLQCKLYDFECQKHGKVNILTKYMHILYVLGIFDTSVHLCPQMSFYIRRTQNLSGLKRPTSGFLTCFHCPYLLVAPKMFPIFKDFVKNKPYQNQFSILCLFWHLTCFEMLKCW